MKRGTQVVSGLSAIVFCVLPFALTFFPVTWHRSPEGNRCRHRRVTRWHVACARPLTVEMSAVQEARNHGRVTSDRRHQAETRGYH